MKMIPKCLLPLLLLVYASTPSPAQLPSTVAALVDSVQKLMEQDKVPGLMMVLMDKDSILWQGGLGHADLQKKVPVTSQHLFRLGSLTKTFTAMAVVKLIEEGKFSLDSKLSELAPEIKFENPWEERGPVRLIHLLEHTAGFDEMQLRVRGKADASRSTKASYIFKQVQLHQGSYKSRWKPGMRMAYSNPGYYLLGYLIEKYGKMPYDRYLKTYVFTPLQMTATRVGYTPSEQYALGYTHTDRFIPAAHSGEQMEGGAAGAVCSNAEDMAKLLRFFLRQSSESVQPFLSEKQLDEMEKQHSTLAAKAGLPYGYGLGLYAKPLGNEGQKTFFLGHAGSIGSFSANFSYNRQQGIGYVLAMSGGYGYGMYSISKLISEFLSKPNTASTLVSKPLDAQKVQPWLGYYRKANTRNGSLSWLDKLIATGKVYIDRDTLQVKRFLGGSESLIPAGGFTFRQQSMPVANAVFVEEKGERGLFIGENYFEQIPAGVLWIGWLAFGLPLVLAALLLLFMLVWIIMLLFKRMKARELLYRSMPLLSALCFALMVYSASTLFGGGASRETIWQVSFYLSITLFPIFALAGVYVTLKNWHQSNKVMRYYLLITSIGLCYIGLYMASNGWLDVLG